MEDLREYQCMRRYELHIWQQLKSVFALITGLLNADNFWRHWPTLLSWMVLYDVIHASLVHTWDRECLLAGMGTTMHRFILQLL